MKKSKLLRTISWPLILVLPLLMFSCYPDGPSATEDLDVVGTMHDAEFNFSGAVTYSIPDTVIHIIGEDDKEEDVDHTYDELMLTTVKTNMDAFGYQIMPIDTTQDPADVVLLVSAITSTNSGVLYNPGWWGYWGYWPGWGYPSYPGYGPGWGYGYPYGGYPVAYSYSTGTVFVNMIDPLQFDLENEIVGVVWMAAINGLLQGNTGETRIREGINQAFKQSEDILKK